VMLRRIRQAQAFSRIDQVEHCLLRIAEGKVNASRIAEVVLASLCVRYGDLRQARELEVGVDRPDAHPPADFDIHAAAEQVSEAGLLAGLCA